MMRIMRRIGTLLAALAVAAVLAGPSLADMAGGGGFYAASVPSPQPTCSQAIGAAVTAFLKGQTVDAGSVLEACQR